MVDIPTNPIDHTAALPTERADIDPTQHPIEGYARAAEELGLDGYFSCPLISHIDGNLWTGGCIEGVKLPPDFDFVLSLYPWQKYALSEGTRRVEIKMYDSNRMHDSVMQAAATAADFISRGQTLIHCQAGLNRSSLIAGLALVLGGMEPKVAIDLLREKRSPMVLCNKTFEKFILNYKETL